MKRKVLLTLGLFIAVAVGATDASVGETAEPPEKTEEKSELGKATVILKKAEAALKKIKLAQYKAKYKGTAWVTAYVPSMEGSATLGELSEHDIARFRCDVKITPTGSSETIELSAGSDGDIYYLIDPKTKTVYADMDEAVLGTHSRNVQRVLLGEFVAKEPLAEDLKAEKVELKEAVEIGGEPCYQVHVTRSEAQGLIWYISKKDYLPRRVDRLYKNPEGELGTTQLEVFELVAKPTFNMAPFRLAVPPGFSKTDEFAP